MIRAIKRGQAVSDQARNDFTVFRAHGLEYGRVTMERCAMGIRRCISPTRRGCARSANSNACARPDIHRKTSSARETSRAGVPRVVRGFWIKSGRVVCAKRSFVDTVMRLASRGADAIPMS